MNAQARTDADDVRTWGSHANKHVGNMWDKIENGYSYNCGYISLWPLTRGTIVNQGGCVMMKNKSYAVTDREHHYIFLKGLLQKPLTQSQSQSGKNILS